MEIPVSLSSFLCWVIVGTKNTIDTAVKKTQAVNNRVETISQIITKATKSNRQVNNRSSKTFREVIETPLSVGLGFHLHKETRSKKITDCLSDLGLSESYDSVMKIENHIANEVLKRMEQNNNVYLPPVLKHCTPLNFAIGNIDFPNGTPHGHSEFHGTCQVVFQNVIHGTESFKFNRDGNKFEMKVDVFIPESFYKPKPPNETFQNFERPKCIASLSIWALFQSVNKDAICQLPPWNAFNSLLSDTLSRFTNGLVKSVCCIKSFPRNQFICYRNETNDHHIGFTVCQMYADESQ